MGIYEQLGIRSIINAQGRYTNLGGSLLAAHTINAMAEAANSYVDMFELQLKVGKRIAELTKNEAAYICNGASAGLFLTTLSCMTGTDAFAIARLPSLTGLKNEIIIHRTHRTPLDPAITLTGAKLVEIGNIIQTSSNELEAAVNEKTAAVVFMPGEFFSVGSLRLQETIDIAHRHGVPVIVDAAQELPPATNLWHFTCELGADLAIFSGGKDICGPQSSGLIVGRGDLIKACYLNGPPHTRLARSMKVGKEEIIGLLVALEDYVKTNHDARRGEFESIIRYWTQYFQNIPGILIKSGSFNGAIERIPRIKIEIDSGVIGLSAFELRQLLLAGTPPIAVENPLNTNAIFLSPETIKTNEENIVAETLKGILLQPPT